MQDTLNSLLGHLITISQQRNCRQLIFLSGDQTWAWKQLACWLANQEDILVVGDKPEEDLDFSRHSKINRPDSVLGQECGIAIFNAHTGLYPDTLAATCGTVKGGGLIIILCPTKTAWPDIEDAFSVKRTPYTSNEVRSNQLRKSPQFVRRILKDVEHIPGIYLIDETKLKLSKNGNLIPSHSQLPEPSITALEISPEGLTDEQQIVFNGIQSNPDICHVITADRGRGKSYLLGEIAQYFLATKRNVFLTAPNKKSASTVLQQIDLSNKLFQFLPPEDVIANVKPNDVLLIDEAASIPIPLLSQWSNHCDSCVFASTTHGYEGTGKGFQIRFFQHLTQYRQNWRHHTLTQPVRYAPNDPVEQWLYNVLCLQAEPNSLPDRIETQNLTFKHVQQSELANNESLLNQLFGLLVQAHYQTKPSDLRDLLDAPGLEIFALTCNDDSKSNEITIASACLCTHEGPIEHSLWTPITQGYRRPNGHLIPQALAFYMGVDDALALKCSRIIRIATHPEAQRQGFASNLLSCVIQWHQQSGFDLLGSSFAATQDVLDFWLQNHFRQVRQGGKLDHASGTHSALVLHALTAAGTTISRLAESQWSRRTAPIASPSELTECERTLLERFIQHPGSWEGVKNILQRIEGEMFAPYLASRKPGHEIKVLLREWLIDSKN